MSAMLTLAVVVAVAVGAAASPVVKAPARAAPGTPATAATSGVTVTAAERACLDDLKLLYPGDGKCYQLLSTGPCKSHEWMVLEARTPDRLRPVCARVPCGDREVLWPRDSRCYQRFRDRETLCPQPGNLLVSSPFGLGECACMRTPPHARDGSNSRSGACYPLHHRGPCQAGHILMPRANGTADQGVCAPDPCLRLQQQGQGQGQGQGMPLVLWSVEAGGDGRCHPLGAEQVCPEEMAFGVHPQTLQPGCLSRINHLLPPTPCTGGQCSPTNTASYSEGYIKELVQAHKMHKTQRRAG